MTCIYKNLIFTKHSFKRLKLRRITRKVVYQVVNHPDRKVRKKQQLTKFIKKIKQRQYHVVACYKVKERKFLVISAWVRGEQDKKLNLGEILKLPFRLCFWLLKVTWKLIKFLW